MSKRYSITAILSASIYLGVYKSLEDQKWIRGQIFSEERVFLRLFILLDHRQQKE